VKKEKKKKTKTDKEEKFPKVWVRSALCIIPNKLQSYL
jgi:hypothetical protein